MVGKCPRQHKQGGGGGMKKKKTLMHNCTKPIMSGFSKHRSDHYVNANMCITMSPRNVTAVPGIDMSCMCEIKKYDMKIYNPNKEIIQLQCPLFFFCRCSMA